MIVESERALEALRDHYVRCTTYESDLWERGLTFPDDLDPNALEWLKQAEQLAMALEDMLRAAGGEPPVRCYTRKGDSRLT